MLYNRNLSNINEEDGPKNKKNNILENKKKQPYAKKDIKIGQITEKYAT